MFTRTGDVYDVQKLVEKPSIYIMGTANDSIAEKLSYTETRLEDLKALQEPMEINGRKVVDVMRFFLGMLLVCVRHVNQIQTVNKQFILFRCIDV